MQEPTKGTSGAATKQPFSNVTRRRFLLYTGLVGGGVLAGGVIGSVLARLLPGGQTQALQSYPKTRIAHLNDVHAGKPIAFDYPLASQPNYLLKLGALALDGIGPDGDIVAFSTTCVHMGCPLAKRYNDAQKVLGPCPCHLSTFDLALGGMPVIGAATENLPQVELTVDAKGDVYAEGVWGLIYGFEQNLQPGNRAK